jgi:sugar O-acyltransferase (sialic acid O-acetyltransferase NeuD family)
MTASALLVWGGGGHGRVVADLVRAAGYAVAGYIDRDPARLGEVVEPGGARVVVTEADFLRGAAAGECANGAVGITLAVGDNRAREACLRRVPGLSAPALVHPSAFVSPSATLGRGTVVLPLAAVNAAARLGDAVVVNTAAVVEHDCVLGDAVHVSPRAVLAGGVHVGERSWIGAGAAVVQGIRVGRDAVVGAGAVVIRDVPDGMTVVGNPARPIQRSEGR